ncbi:hypothetical protein CF58_23110 [Escherichia coli]|nr:hypothetical protein CF58_23110 [Escherichia coli]AHM49571.1 hypothetical protein CF59_23100 [Escherichia coli]AHM54029.1 hypothetical protein CF60_22775 [Escherichia coli]
MFPAPAGINRFAVAQSRRRGSVPRPAGINRVKTRSEPTFMCVPRVSGDKPDALDAMMDITWSSPPLR